jgi:hypothetical protein
MDSANGEHIQVEAWEDEDERIEMIDWSFAQGLRLIYGDGGGDWVIAREDWMRDIAALQMAIVGKKPWAEYKATVSAWFLDEWFKHVRSHLEYDDEYEPLKITSKEDIPDDLVPPNYVFSEHDWPGLPWADVPLWLPGPRIDEYGDLTSGGSGPASSWRAYAYIPDVLALVTELEEHGAICTRDDDIALASVGGDPTRRRPLRPDPEATVDVRKLVAHAWPTQVEERRRAEAEAAVRLAKAKQFDWSFARDEDVVYGHAPGEKDRWLVLPRWQAEEIADTRGALERVRTWGEARQAVPGHRIDEMTEMLAARGEFDEHGTYAGLTIATIPDEMEFLYPTYDEDQFPEWSDRAMIRWLPEAIRSGYGEEESNRGSHGYRIADIRGLLTGLRSVGARCRRDDELISDAYEGRTPLVEPDREAHPRAEHRIPREHSEAGGVGAEGDEDRAARMRAMYQKAGGLLLDPDDRD